MLKNTKTELLARPLPSWVAWQEVPPLLLAFAATVNKW
jgi:hypothetical protein